MSTRNLPEQCPECLHMDGDHRPNCKVKAAWDAVCIPWTAEDKAAIFGQERTHGKGDTWKQLK